ncbi:MAG: sll0787 family AIR synthase-like protein [Pseudomonadota bacterium]
MSADPAALAEALRAHPAIRGKLAIRGALEGLSLGASSTGQPGDDAAILPRPGGYDLLAGEGFIPAFVRDDPWFAGWCGVMVNLSDIAAMGGRPTALVNQVWAPSEVEAQPLLKGLRDAASAYDVPIVGGHTNFHAPDLGLAVSVMGRASRVITSTDASPGDHLVLAVDHRGTYQNFDNFCAALEVPTGRLAGDLDILPAAAEAGLVSAGKDISQGGIAGTALMLAESAGVGLDLDLGRIAPPDGVALERWLRTFPSFGFLLSVAPEAVPAVLARFTARDIWASAIGRVTEGSAVRFLAGGATAEFWDYSVAPYLGLAPEGLVDA